MCKGGVNTVLWEVINSLKSVEVEAILEDLLGGIFGNAHWQVDRISSGGED